MSACSRLDNIQGDAQRHIFPTVTLAISDMCMDNVANQIAIAKASGIPPLITWMSGSLDRFGFSAEAQREAARAVLGVTSNNPTTQVPIA